MAAKFSRDQKTWQGIHPKTLLEQIQNTVPFLFAVNAKGESQELPKNQSYLTRLYEIAERLNANTKAEFSNFEYFEFCLIAHFVTVGSYVPTDVDNQIRLKIWQSTPDSDVQLQMLNLIEAMYEWDILPVAARFVAGIETSQMISGIEGEWLGEMAAAYSALRKKNPKAAKNCLEKICADLSVQATIISEHKKKGNGIEVAKAATLIAHNLGDLDRVMDLWQLPNDDPLRIAAYKIGHAANERFSDFFLWVGNMNKRYMAAENHRNFPLREPRALRREREYLLPIAPFFDDWGKVIARAYADQNISERELAEILEALIKGFERLKTATGYARALAGIESVFPGGKRALEKVLPRGLAKNWNSGKLRTLISEPEEKFYARWKRIDFSI